MLELFGGIAVVLGLLTRPAALSLASTMVVAILQVHIKNGFFMQNSGYEFALSLLGATLALVAAGAGSFSVDALIAKRAWNEAQLAAVPLAPDARKG